MRAKFPTVIVATAFKFHAGSVLLIDLVPSALGRAGGRSERRRAGGLYRAYAAR